MCGLPGVVSDVGDLGDLVNDSNGSLVSPLTAQNFADAFQRVLGHGYENYAAQALESSYKYQTPAVITHWDRIFDNWAE